MFNLRNASRRLFAKIMHQAGLTRIARVDEVQLESIRRGRQDVSIGPNGQVLDPGLYGRERSVSQVSRLDTPELDSPFGNV